ncbi:MAG TPA: hypothetical protein VHZ33_22950 [Trebonia sp.]|nr:hypothetical protein [Trebonia sp.]
MREVPEEEHAEWVRRLRERARLDAEALIPRPGFPIYGLAAPALTPAAVTESTRIDGEWSSITIAYGPWDEATGPYLAVTTTAAGSWAEPVAASATTLDDDAAEEALRFAVEEELARTATGGETEETESAEPPVVTRETLPAGPALVCRSGTVWAAGLRPADPAARVVVSIVGRGVAPESVRLQTVQDLRPMVEARNAMIDARLARARRAPRPPLPELEPAEGVAAFLALAEFTLAEQADLRGAHGDGGRRPRPQRSTGSGRVRSALWQRAVSEQQRLRGVDAATADYAVTSVVNQLGFLLGNAPWFSADRRLRAAAIDETLRHAMLADTVPSEPAQAAWERHWSTHLAWRPVDPDQDAIRARMQQRQALTSACLLAWTAWAATA